MDAARAVGVVAIVDAAAIESVAVATSVLAAVPVVVTEDVDEAVDDAENACVELVERVSNNNETEGIPLRDAQAVDEQRIELPCVELPLALSLARPRTPPLAQPLALMLPLPLLLPLSHALSTRLPLAGCEAKALAVVLGASTVGDMSGEAVPEITDVVLESDCESSTACAALSVGSCDTRCVVVELRVPAPISVEAEREDEPETLDERVALVEALSVVSVAESVGTLESEGNADTESAALTPLLNEAYALALTDAVLLDEGVDDVVGLFEGEAAGDYVSIAVVVADEGALMVAISAFAVPVAVPVGDDVADGVQVDELVDVAVKDASIFDVREPDDVAVSEELVVVDERAVVAIVADAVSHEIAVRVVNASAVLVDEDEAAVDAEVECIALSGAVVVADADKDKPADRVSVPIGVDDIALSVVADADEVANSVDVGSALLAAVPDGVADDDTLSIVISVAVAQKVAAATLLLALPQPVPRARSLPLPLAVFECTWVRESAALGVC